MTESIWSQTAEIPERTPLNGDKRVEAAVIGAGMAGVLTAYLLKEQGYSVAVLEADRIGRGQTRNTTAKITSQHGLIYQDFIRMYGEKQAGLYAQAQEGAIREYERIIREKKIECHFERLPAYLYSALESNREKLKQEAEAAAGLGLPAHYLEGINLPGELAGAGAVRFDNQAQFHPLEFIRELSKDLTIYEKTKVLSVKENRIVTARGTVTAKYVIFASHYPFQNLPGLYFARQHQERSYVIAYEGGSLAETLAGMYYSIDAGGLSLRSWGKFLLVGGSGHRTGKNEPGGRYLALQRAAESYFPDGQQMGREAARWSAQDCMPHDRLPFIGRYSVLSPDWYVASGFQKWGMTSSMVSAMLIRDEICGIKNPYEKLFSPQRLHPAAAAKDFAVDMWESMKGLARGFLLLFGKKEKARRCPHMGCGLRWNPDEESWDCPCHGSRFDRQGHILDDPAQTSLRGGR